MVAPDRKIRLCLAAHSFFPAYGGAQLRFLRYIPGLRARGVDTEIFTGEYAPAAEDKGHGHRLGRMLPREEVEGAPLYRICLPERKDDRRFLIFDAGLLKICEREESRPHVIQLLNKLAPSSLRLLRRLQASGIPIVYSVSIAPLEQKYGKSLGKSIKKYRNWRYYRKLYNQMDCIVTNNIQLKDMVREMGVRTRIEVIANGIDFDRFQIDTSHRIRHAVRQRLGIAGTDRVICSVGALIPRKGTDLLVEAWARLVKNHPDLHLMLVGPFVHTEEDPFRQHIQSVIEKSGHGSQVHFVGKVENVEDYLSAADVFVLPSEREGLPNSVLEAMALSRPVVITPFIGLSADLGQAEVHYLLSQRNVEDLAFHIARLMNDPMLRMALGQRGHQLVVETMDLQYSLDRYADLYKELANKTVSISIAR